MQWSVGRKGWRTLAALGGLALLGCVSPTPPAPHAAGRTPGGEEGITVIVAGEHRDFASATVRLCSEGLPAELRVEVTAGGPRCPERLVEGPAGTPVSRGRLCDELLVQVRGFQRGVPVEARGSSAALVAYSRYEEPTLKLTTGDAGPRGTTGSITIEELAETAADELRLRFSISLTGEAEVDASAAVSVAPAPCAAAGPGLPPG